MDLRVRAWAQALELPKRRLLCSCSEKGRGWVWRHGAKGKTHLLAPSCMACQSRSSAASTDEIAAAWSSAVPPSSAMRKGVTASSCSTASLGASSEAKGVSAMSARSSRGCSYLSSPSE